MEQFASHLKLISEVYYLCILAKYGLFDGKQLGWLVFLSQSYLSHCLHFQFQFCKGKTVKRKKTNAWQDLKLAIISSS